MKIRLDILRRDSSEAAPYTQSFIYETDDENATVATALCDINSQAVIRDAEGNAAKPIKWQCSCLQKKCGACAMVINSKPRLACDAALKEFEKSGCVSLGPLRKFKNVADLMVDRSVMFDNLKALGAWLDDKTKADERTLDTAYDASRCLQCGCCLEVCPNFYPEGEFCGMSAAAPMSRLIAAMPKAQQRKAYKQYRAHIYEGCGKSLACRDICPAGIDIDAMLVNSNAAAVWKRRAWRKRGSD